MLGQNLGQGANRDGPINEGPTFRYMKLLHDLVEGRQAVVARIVAKDQLAGSLANARDNKDVTISSGVFWRHPLVGIDVQSAPTAIVEQPRHRVQAFMIASNIDITSSSSMPDERPEVQILTVLRIRDERLVERCSHGEAEMASAGSMRLAPRRSLLDRSWCHARVDHRNGQSSRDSGLNRCWQQRKPCCADP